MPGKLVLVATPIGNLGDVSYRMIRALKESDFIAAEDTRVTLKLLNYLGIKKTLISYFEHNKFQKESYIVQRILNGETCVLVSDAGLPAISDPGENLVSQCYKKGIKVTVIPGACALISALVISGLPTNRFTFEGFLSVNKKRRMEHLNSIKNEFRTMIFYEAPHKFLQTLEDLLSVLGNRRISIVRELTKIHEEVVQSTLEELVNIYKKNKIKGEIVLIVEGANQKVNKKIYTLEEATCEARKLLDIGFAKNDAAKEISKITHVKKSDIYKNLLGE